MQLSSCALDYHHSSVKKSCLNKRPSQSVGCWSSLESTKHGCWSWAVDSTWRSCLNTLLLCLQVSTGVLIVREEGVLRLWAGWRPAVTRAMLYGGEGCWETAGPEASSLCDWFTDRKCSHPVCEGQSEGRSLGVSYAKLLQTLYMCQAVHTE
jgi:hypothetical protein